MTMAIYGKFIKLVFLPYILDVSIRIKKGFNRQEYPLFTSSLSSPHTQFESEALSTLNN